jgi:tRNA A-37 threonylcarbamoyl transferase component Bud32/Tfp pilus assembly protein PilF
MEPDRWRQVERLYHAALDRDPEARAAFLATASGDDEELLNEVQSLLGQHSGDSRLDRAVWEPGAESTDTRFAAGTQLGQYRIEAALGAGGMGEVFRARDSRLNRTVAIKISQRRFTGRFKSEARAVAALNHPNIVQIYELGSEAGDDFIVMEFVPGRTLAELLRDAPLGLDQALEYAIQIAAALAAAHAAGVVHRDIKPGNIIVSDAGVVKILDFGLAKVEQNAVASDATVTAGAQTGAGTVIGTAAYMSPEQAECKAVDARSDIFSIGAVFYEMLTGRRAFDGDSTAGVLSKVLRETPRGIRELRPEVPEAITRIVSRCLEKDPALRYPSGRELAGELIACRRPAGRRAMAPTSRWGIAAALVLAALGGGAWWTFQSKPQALIDGATPSAIHAANDQYNLAFTFLIFQNDIPLARKTFERALELDPHFASARLQHVLAILIEIFNGYRNDGSALYQAEEELHQAEQALPDSDGMILSAQTAVYLAQGRLDRIPLAKLEEYLRKGGNPTWLVILQMLKGQTEEPLAILRTRVERNPLEAPSRMFLGELLRTQGDTAGAILALERVIQQAPRNITAAWFLTMAYLDKGKPEQARALLEGMRPEFEKNYMWRHAWAILLAAEGKQKEALQAMDEGTLKFARLSWDVTSTTADFYALQGDRAKAIEWLQLAIARGDERVSYFRRNPRLAPLRNDTRFQSLLKSVEARHQ